jgi:hypothetical protein
MRVERQGPTDAGAILLLGRELGRIAKTRRPCPICRTRSMALGLKCVHKYRGILSLLSCFTERWVIILRLWRLAASGVALGRTAAKRPKRHSLTVHRDTVAQSTPDRRKSGLSLASRQPTA